MDGLYRSAPRGRDGRAVRRGVGADDGGRRVVGARIPVGRRALEEGRRDGRLVGSVLRPRRLEAGARDQKRPLRFPAGAPLPLARETPVTAPRASGPNRRAPSRSTSSSRSRSPEERERSFRSSRGSSIPGHEEHWETWAEIHPESAARLGIGDRAWSVSRRLRARSSPARASRRGSCRASSRSRSGSANAPRRRWASGIGANPLQLLSPGA